MIGRKALSTWGSTLLALFFCIGLGVVVPAKALWAQAGALPPLGPDVAHVVAEFAARYPNEVAVCLLSSDGQQLDGWTLPAHKGAHRTGVSPAMCDDPQAVAHLHTHPIAVLGNPQFRVWFYNTLGKSPGGAWDLCFYAGRDRESALRESQNIRWYAIAVDEKTLCWWTREQIEAAYDPQAESEMPLWSIPGQRTW